MTTSQDVTTNARTAAEALISERFPKTIERRESKAAIINRLTAKRASVENQLRICQASVERLDEDLKERAAQVAAIDHLIEEAIEARIRAEELRPEYQAGVMEGRTDEEFLSLKKELLALDAVVNNLGVATGKRNLSEASA
jgi:hypothetical protein